MSISFQPTRLVGAIALAMGFSSTTFAQSPQQKEALLDPIVITAARSEEKISEVPARISVISKQEIEKNPLKNVGDILNKEAGINVVQTGGMGQTTTAFVRGTDSKHVLILKDGASLNTALDGGANLAFLDLSDAKQIEVLKGPASVQYGSDAIGGVVHIISDTPTKNTAFVTGIYGENQTYKTIVGADLATEQGIYAQVRGQRLESDGTPVVDSSQDKASFDQKGYSAKVGIQQEQFESSVSIAENQGTNIYYGGSHDFKNQLINVKGALQIHPDLNISARYSNFKDELENAIYIFKTDRDEADLNLDWKMTAHQNILVGASLNNADVESLSIQGKKKSLDSTGYYLQHQYNNAGVHTQAGVRVEDNDQFGTHTVGQLAGRVQIAPLTSIYANIGTAFKAPTGNQLYYVYENPQWGNTYGNPDLKPEKSISYEIGLDQKLAYGISAYSSIYYTEVKNLIQYVSVFPNSTYENVQKANMRGGEFGLKWQQDDLFVSTEYSYVKTDSEKRVNDQVVKAELARRPKQGLTLTAGLENAQYGISTSLVAKSESKISNTPTSKSMSGYATIDLNAYWNVNPHIKLFTNIQNVGDVQFKTAQYTSYPTDVWYINGGRQASAGVTFRY